MTGFNGPLVAVVLALFHAVADHPLAAADSKPQTYGLRRPARNSRDINDNVVSEQLNTR